MKLEIDFNNSIEELTAGLNRYSPLTKKIIDRTSRKVLTWLKRQIKREVALHHGISQRSLNTRVSSNYFPRNNFGYVFLGANDLPAYLAGKPSQSRSSPGTKVRKHNFKGAFYEQVYGDEKRVWMRKYRGKGSSAKSEKLVGGYHSLNENQIGRFPVFEIKIELDNSEVVLKRLEQATMKRFTTIFNQEMNYALNHEKT